MRIEFDDAHGAVIVSDEGTLTGERFGYWLRELSVEPEFTLELHQIFDLSAMEGLPRTEAELERFVRVAASFNRSRCRVAVVLPGGFGPGLDERIEALSASELKREMRILGTREAALSWVAS